MNTTEINPSINDDKNKKTKVVMHNRNYSRPLNEDDREFLDAIRKGMGDTLSDTTWEFERMQREVRKRGDILIND